MTDTVPSLTPDLLTAFERLYRDDANFRVVADTARRNGWSPDQIVTEYLLDLQAEDDDE